MVLDLLKEQSEKAARKLSSATLASSPNRASSQKDSFKKPASPTSSRKTSPGPGAKKRARVWSPGPQGKRKGIPKRPGGITRQAAQQRRAGRSLPPPLQSRWPLRGPEPPHHVEAAAAEHDFTRAGSWGWRWVSNKPTVLPKRTCACSITFLTFFFFKAECNAIANI